MRMEYGGGCIRNCLWKVPNSLGTKSGDPGPGEMHEEQRLHAALTRLTMAVPGKK